MIQIPIETINQVLPQTQCRECGFSGCLPYAKALATGEANINLCVPGGKEVIQELAHLLKQPIIEPAKPHQNALAWIDENVCIGCTACIRACPVDAIMGASKHMHTVITDECTGCGLCVAPCPVDCIYMQPVADTYLPRSRQLSTHHNNQRLAAASHAQQRYQNHQQRQQHLAVAKQQHLAKKQQTLKRTATTTNQKPTVNTAALIAQAMAKAQAQQNNRVVPINRNSFRDNQIKEAQEKALYRRYMRDARYGNEAEKATAITWLKQHKVAKQENAEKAQQTD